MRIFHTILHKAAETLAICIKIQAIMTIKGEIRVNKEFEKCMQPGPAIFQKNPLDFSCCNVFAYIMAGIAENLNPSSSSI